MPLCGLRRLHICYQIPWYMWNAPLCQQLRLTKRDGETLLDQLGNVPESLRKSFGRPGLTLGDFIDTGHTSMAQVDLAFIVIYRCAQPRPCIWCQGCGPWAMLGPASLLRTACLPFFDRPCLQKRSVSVPTFLSPKGSSESCEAVQPLTTFATSPLVVRSRLRKSEI